MALIALLALELIEPVNPDLARGCGAAQPALVARFRQRTQPLDRLAGALVDGRGGAVGGQPDRDANRCRTALKVIIAVLPAPEPPKTQNFGLFLRLEQLKQGIQPDQAIGDDQLKLALNRHGHDPLAVMACLSAAATSTTEPWQICGRRWSTS